MSAGKFLGKSVDVVEVAVGLVLVLLVQLGLVEAIVIELGRGRSRRRANGSLGCCGLLRRGRERHCADEVSDVFLPVPAFLVSILYFAGEDVQCGKRTLLRAQVLNIDGLRFLGRRSVQSGAAHTSRVGARTAECSGQGVIPNACALDGEGLAHDGAALGEHLQVGHAAGAGRDMVFGGRRGERA